MRFLHYIKSEMWGRMWKVRAGNGKTGRKIGAVQLANPLYKAKIRRSEKEVAKLMSHVPRKAAIVFNVPVP